MYTVEQYNGTAEGWSQVTTWVDPATACRRLRLNRAIHGWQFTYRIRRKWSEKGLDLVDLPFAFSN
jgi:hypothetical protein